LIVTDDSDNVTGDSDGGPNRSRSNRNRRSRPRNHRSHPSRNGRSRWVGIRTKRRDGSSTLLVQVDGEAIDGATVDPEKAFRVWAFGADGARHLEPSALRLLGREKRDAPRTLRSLNKLTSTLDAYAHALDLPYLRAACPHIQSLILHCDVLPKPSSRYEVFHDNVQNFFDFLVEAQLKKLEGPFSRLYVCISQLRDFLSSGKRISRSNIEAFDSQLWWQLAPYLNQFRLRGYLPTENAGFCTHLPSPASDAISKLMFSDEVVSTGRKAKWLIALNKLTFDEVFQIRSILSFRNVLEELGEIWRTNDEGASERYCAVLRTKWRDELAGAVSTVAPNCVVDKKKGEGKWIPPVSQFSGFAAGATTLAIVGTTAAPPVVGLAVVGVGGAVHLSLLGAKTIADSFLIDKPDLAACRT
jgi:hypothetical protein